MPSSSSSSNSPPKPPRSASFLGSLRSIVVAPLTWLAGSEESDTAPKRRRLDTVDESSVPDTTNGHFDDGSVRAKRARRSSPSRLPPNSAYLDPPSSAFHTYQPRRRTPMIPLARSSSATHPSRSNLRRNTSRSTLSPMRLSRNTSLGPPLSKLQISRDVSMTDVTAESSLRAVSLSREQSLTAVEALAPRPGWKVGRCSMTPQPPPEAAVSNPPAIDHLMQQSTFLRPPKTRQESRGETPGHLVDTARSSGRSPVRRTNSINLPHTIPSPPTDISPAERALHELDIYKTPLVPTRLREANQTIAGTSAEIPSMFKPRRKIIMDGDHKPVKKSKRSKTQEPDRNQSKPYAGSGGMRKLLARRKQEEAEEDAKDKDSKEAMRNDSETVNPEAAPPVVDSKPALDWFAAASVGLSLPNSGSSLRVGRANRTHMDRPHVRHRPQFSANYDDDDDVMEPETEEKRTTLEEADKKTPTSNAPAGFSFTTPDAQPLQQDLTNAKEAPISSLPFSLGKPAPVPEAPKPEASQSRKENAEAPTSFSFADKPTEPSRPTFSFADAPPLSASEPSREPDHATPAPNGIPTFEKSMLMSKPVAPPTAPVLTFPSSTTVPATDKENPFWDGNKKPSEKADAAVPEIKVSAPIASGFSFGPSKAATAAPTGFSFDKPTAVPSSNPFAPSVKSTPPADSVPEAPKSLFGPPAVPAFGAAPKTSSDVEPASSGAVPNFFGTVGRTEAKSLFGTSKAEPAVPAAAPVSTPFSFGPPSSATAEAPKVATPASSLFAFGPSATATAEVPKPAPAASPFSFGQPPAEVAKPAVSASTPFSFAASDKDAAAKPSPFSFGAAKETETASKPPPFSFGTSKEKDDAPKSTPFLFGSTPSTPTTNPTGFSFGKPDAPTTPSSSAPFSFGAPGVSATTASSGFSFGATSAAAERAKTPENGSQEFGMEMSPTRELRPEPGSKPSLNFSFNQTSNGTSSLFGSGSAAPSPATAPASPFSFGASAASNPFGTPVKPEEPKPAAFSFGSAASTPTTTAAPFSFGAPKPATSEPVVPSFGGFGSTAPAAAPPLTSAPSPFSFGSGPPASNPFGPAPSSPAPGSPSTFNQPSPFAFGAAPLPPATSSNAFSFGSQPASPATSNSGLPASGGFGSTGNAFGAAAPSSPFGSPAQLALSTSTGGGSLFTIGAAPAASPGAPRQIRKLPSRRTGTAKR